MKYDAKRIKEIEERTEALVEKIEDMDISRIRPLVARLLELEDKVNKAVDALLLIKQKLGI